MSAAVGGGPGQQLVVLDDAAGQGPGRLRIVRPLLAYQEHFVSPAHDGGHRLPRDTTSHTGTVPDGDAATGGSHLRMV